jgi:hypothetical protein
MLLILRRIRQELKHDGPADFEVLSFVDHTHTAAEFVGNGEMVRPLGESLADIFRLGKRASEREATRSNFDEIPLEFLGVPPAKADDITGIQASQFPDSIPGAAAVPRFLLRSK